MRIFLCNFRLSHMTANFWNFRTFLCFVKIVALVKKPKHLKYFLNIHYSRVFKSFRIRAHLHNGEEFVDEVSTKCQRIVDEVSAKDFTSPAKFFLPKTSPRRRRQRICNLVLIFSAKLIFFCNF